MKKVLPSGKFFGVTDKRMETDSYTFVDVKAFPNKYIPTHSHETAHFVFVIDGVFKTTLREKEVQCHSSTVLYQPAGVTHQDHNTESGQYLTVTLGSRVNKKLLSGIDFLEDSENLGQPEILWLSRKIYRELYMADDLSGIVLEGLANELLVFAARRLDKSDKPPDWLKLAYELINDTCNSEITIAEIAETIGIHPIHLARTFRRFFHCSPGEYLRNCRIDFATNLLLTSDKSLVEIALLSGFADQSQFTRSFKRNMGVTPKQFCKAHSSSHSKRFGRNV